MGARRKKKKAKKTAKKRGGKREVLCVGSKVKAYVKSQGMKCSGDLVVSVSDQVHKILDEAITRTTENRRSTVRPHDL
jgi:hypothetical protein